MHWLFGKQAVMALIKHNPQRIKALYLQTKTSKQPPDSLLTMAQAEGIPCHPLTQSAFEQQLAHLQQTQQDSSANQRNVVHQGVIAEVEAPTPWQEQDLKQLLSQLDHPALLLILDGVTDPHNLGACLRSANAAGVDAVIIPKHNAVGLNATVCKVACGAADLTPLIEVTNLARTIKQLQQQGIWVYGTSEKANKVVYHCDLTDPIALVMGSEAKGLRRLTEQCCDDMFKLPTQGLITSLNVSVATGICLFEAVRQRFVIR